MTKIIDIQNTANCHLYHDVNRMMIAVIWKPAPLTDRIYKETFNTAIRYQENYPVNIPNYMADVRLQPPISVELRKWFTDETLQRGIYAGIKRAGFVVNANILKRYYMNQIMNSLKKFGIPFKFFKNHSDVLNWVDSQMH
ncbi:MAG: hypothetical protein U9N85_06355 [Bacteroidota bacterium]|nr:hypothetical protein [Bacteroidota bacterium]